jgi:UDP-3-O-[3-hydroxymyristoyl] glucosamine N-acyltransferase
LPARKTLLICDQPRLVFARAAKLLQPHIADRSGVHPSAVVHPSAKLSDQVLVGPYAVIEEGASIGARTHIGAGSVIGQSVVIEEDCKIKSRVTIYPGTRVGPRAVVHAGVVLGSDGFGYVRDSTTGKYEQFPQIGTLAIGSDVEIGANSTVDRGALEETVIADGVKIDNLVHVGHNVRIGKNVVIAAQTGISGSVVIEDNVIIAGQVGIADHVHVEAGAILGAQCGVPTSKTIRGKGMLFWGTPARPIKEYLRELATLSRLAKKGGR